MWGGRQGGQRDRRIQQSQTIKHGEYCNEEHTGNYKTYSRGSYLKSKVSEKSFPRERCLNNNLKETRN